MLLDKDLMDKVAEQAKASPRLRMNYDLRTQAFEPSGSWADTSQRMINVLMPGTVIPIHRHNETSETVICIRGAVEEDCCAIQVPRGVYHTCRCLEPGSVTFEAKDRAYDPERTEDFL